MSSRISFPLPGQWIAGAPIKEVDIIDSCEVADEPVSLLQFILADHTRIIAITWSAGVYFARTSPLTGWDLEFLEICENDDELAAEQSSGEEPPVAFGSADEDPRMVYWERLQEFALRITAANLS